MRIQFFTAALLLCCCAAAQKNAVVKKYPEGTLAGELRLVQSSTITGTTRSEKKFTVQAERSGTYEMKSIAFGTFREPVTVLVDGRAIGLQLQGQAEGWQLVSAARNGQPERINLTAGMHEISFVASGESSPLVDDIYFQSVPGQTAFDQQWNRIKSTLDEIAAQPVLDGVAAEAEKQAAASLVLPNPEGTYDHQVDISFSYTYYNTIYLTAGTVVTFTTENSTADPVVYLFDLDHFDTRSWSDDDSGPGTESSLTVTIPATANYSIMVRSFGGIAGTTNIKKNGAVYANAATIGGARFYVSSKTGTLNYFTCKSTGDTRIFAANYSGTPIRGYNDDYATSGSWFWNGNGRIKRTFSEYMGYVVVCAYSLASAGTCDVYMGCENSDVWSGNYSEFPYLHQDDAIKSAPSSGTYNCISWSGGVTSTWIWPPNLYSTYNCTSSFGDISCFDNFYSNNPARYPGAWNFTRTGATSANNDVDLWKYGSSFTHGSVRKPGNGHPHGYDWESKPGGLTRTFHPRNDLYNPTGGYGSVTNYYKATGTYASRNGEAYASDAAAVAAGVAVFENAQLSRGANEKLDRFLSKLDDRTVAEFEKLYAAWKATWASNAMYSDPDMYCKNEAYEAMAQFCFSHPSLLYKVFEKFVGGDHFIGKLQLDMTRKKYIALLKEAKDDILRKPYDDQGRYIVHGDHDNGVRYVEKILAAMEETNPETAAVSDIAVSISPNPVRDIATVQLVLANDAMVQVEMVSMLTGKNMLVQPARKMAKGIQRIPIAVRSLGIANGDAVAVKVTVDGQIHTVKATVVK